MSRMVCVLVLLGCGGGGRIIGGPIKCDFDAQCSAGLFCHDGQCQTPAQPLGEAPPDTSEALYARVRQSEFDLDVNAGARQEVLFSVGVGKQRGFELSDKLTSAHFALRFEGDNLRMWALSMAVPGKEVVVPSVPGENKPESRFLLQNIRIRLSTDAVAPLLYDAFPKAAADFRAKLIVNADMGSGPADMFGVELHLDDVLMHIDLDVASRRLTSHVLINEQHLLYGQLDSLYIDGFSLDAVLQGVVLPATWIDTPTN